MSAIGSVYAVQSNRGPQTFAERDWVPQTNISRHHSIMAVIVTYRISFIVM